MKIRIALLLGLLSLVLGSAQASEKTAGNYVDDGWLHTKIKAAMVGHGSSGVNVEVYQGVVQLAGFLTGKGNKENLLAAVKGVKGVKRISDQLHLVDGDRTAGEVVDDNTLTTAVKATLVDAGMIGVNVEVNRGRVLLTGFVDDDEVRDKAVARVKGVKRVVKVINGMDLKG